MILGSTPDSALCLRSTVFASTGAILRTPPIPSINERGDGENELGERLHDILDALYDAHPDELLEDVSDS